jgi:hypothetical protein
VDWHTSLDSLALKDLFASERGLLGPRSDHLRDRARGDSGSWTPDQWIGFVEFVFGAYVVGKTTTGVTQIIKGTPTPTPVTPSDPS